MSDPKDYRIEIKVKNNRLLTKMEEAGYPSVAKLAEAIGMSRTVIYRIVSIKSTALDEKGYYRPEALRIAEFLNCTPQDIYPPAQMRGTMKENKAQITANANEVDSLTSSLRTLALSPERKMIIDEAQVAIKQMLLELTPREHRVIDLVYGLTYGEEMTLDRIGETLGVSRERIRQIEGKALRKMKWRHRSKEMRTALEVLAFDLRDED